jgi:hypothetical protein
MKSFILGALVAVAIATAAIAAPAREGAVSASAPVFAWDGGPGNGSGQGVAAVRCTPAVYECEDTLVKVGDAGDLTAEIKAGEGANDLDVAIYKSDESGTTDSAPGADNPNAEDTSDGPNAKTTLKKVTPGYYVVRVRFFDGIQASYSGTATLKTPAPAVTTPPAATPTPPPASTPPSQSSAPTKPSAKERRNACIKKAKKKYKGSKNRKKRAKAIKRCQRIK